MYLDPRVKLGYLCSMTTAVEWLAVQVVLQAAACVHDLYVLWVYIGELC